MYVPVTGRLVPVLLALALSAPRAFGQETTATLDGRVLDGKGQPIPQVRVVVSSPGLQGTRGALTGPGGEFAILALPIGEYSVQFEHMAYQRREIANVNLRLGQTTGLGDIRLEEQVYPVAAIVVPGRAAGIDRRSTVLGDNLSARDYEALPVDRDYKNLAALLPHTTSSALGDPLNFAGATGLENRYFVDGNDVTDSFRNATGTNLPYNFIQEVEVRTGGYEAEYRSSLGGTVNAVTYSGGNQVSGQVFGFFTSNGFSATPQSVPGTSTSGQSYAVYDFGFGVGGPIVRDRLWYFGAYNPSFHTEDVAIPGWRNFDDHRTTHSFAGKLTWRANANHTLVVTGTGDPTQGRQVSPPLVQPANVDPFLFEIRQGGYGIQAEERYVASDRLLLRTTLARSRRKENTVPESELGRSEVFFVDSMGTPSGGGSQSVNESGVTTAAVNATWLLDDHKLKAGVEYKDTRLEFDTQYDILVQNSATSYYYQLAAFKGHVGSRLPSAYAQDSWRLTERVQLNLGLRWSGEYWVSSEGKVAQTILGEWQPRVGVTFQPGPPGSQKVYASYGRFYQDLTDAPLFWYYNRGSFFYAANYDHDPRVDPSGANVLGSTTGAIQPKVDGLRGQYFDEYTLGYERQLGPQVKLGVHGIERILREGIEDGYDFATGTPVIGNPGRAQMDAFPRMERDYSALDVSCEGGIGRNVSVLGSYVLSRNYGNHQGLFDSYGGNPYPNATSLYDVPEELVNARGCCPTTAPTCSSSPRATARARR